MNESMLTRELARLALSSHPEESAEAFAAARLGVIDFLASSFAARDEEAIAKLWRVVKAEGGHAQVPVIGQGEKVSFLQASLLNGLIGHALDYDDVHSDVRGHPSTVILPALISVAATEKPSGERFLAAYVIGVETMARLGQAIGPDHYVKGWHNTATLGGIAAAVAAAYLKRFSQAAMEKVIGFAATQASGLRIQFGSEMKPLHPGLAAHAALLSLKLAEEGFAGTRQALDGQLGFFGLYGDGDQDRAKRLLVEGWGEPWKIVTPGLWFKRYPFCSAAYHAADAAVRLREKNKLSPQDIEKVEIIFPPDGDAALVEREPQTGEEGRFSVEYVVALALNGYPLSLDNFTKAPLAEEIKRFLPRIHRSYDAKLSPVPHAVPKGRFTIVAVTTTDGTTYCERIDRPKGAPGQPLSSEELRQKLEHALAGEPDRAERIIGTVSALKGKEDLQQLLFLLSITSRL
ncbi:MmgE/PrpD family protein [Desmospora activa]|uniref:2-methylcitrate dehydratase PrpD n=1 Tax=Desmospora activa DSM 45169 TaxID=1121389 RepID=A0A2T4Z3U4_9BACL|nr:MmgE/PrpD family protein [Desmospora activa]PTM56557.1 2-methylcitrate dehydratase PrpD [Desmospora activa DSM 45169]